jgi:hypothetical protein
LGEAAQAPEDLPSNLAPFTGGVGYQARSGAIDDRDE